MVINFGKSTSLAIQKLYKEDDDLRELFDWCATLKRDATETSVDTIASKLNISRKGALNIVRQLESAGCGEFLVGRRGGTSRFIWKYSRISLGKVASGEFSEIEGVQDPIEGDEEMTDVGNFGPMTIAKAKSMLADALGVKSEQIEIHVRG